MNSTYTNLRSHFFASEQGQAVVEYAVLLAAIIGLLAFVTGFGLAANRVLNWISNQMF